MRKGVYNRFQQIALPDEFLDAGALPTLHDRYGIVGERGGQTFAKRRDNRRARRREERR